MTSVMASRIGAVIATALICLVAAGQVAPKPAPATAEAMSSTEDWDRYSAGFLEWYFTTHPTTAVWAGRHEFDGQLPNWSAAGIQSVIERLRVERGRASAFAVDRLDTRQRLERQIMISKINGELFWLESAQWQFRSPSFYGALDPNDYVVREYAPLAQRLQAYTAYAKAIPAATEQIRHNLRTPMPRTFIQIGHIQFGGLARFYEKDVPAIFNAVENPRLQGEFRLANAGAIKAMRDLDAWLAQQESGATDDFALGAQKFEDMFRATEGVDVSLARLKQIGEDDLERNLNALRDACAAFAPGRNLQDCVRKVAADKPNGSVVDVATGQLDQLKAFVQSRQIVSIPGSEQAQVRESPPHRRSNPAYISIPGPYEKNLPSIYYIAPPDPAWTEAEQDAYIPSKAILLFISAHEVWPGHFLQFMHSNRSPSRLGQVFISYAFAEGWAHYCEEMMWEEGLGNGDAEVHIGQLINALLRDVRYLSAIGLHTGSMTVAQSEAMFREKAFQDPGNARQQAARGTYDPAYGNYTLGKLMIRKLREDWTSNHDGRSSWRAFHDEFLSYGAPPIPLVRSAMLGDGSGSPL
jgi:Bacterial protein of unknown function (DUF885)